MSDTSESLNPFDVTKAVRFSDAEILETFVEMDFVNRLISPVSETPLLLTGGKGSGRTHLLRYWSYPVQMMRSGGSFRDMVHRNNYVGIYLLIGGLNPARFRSDSMTEDASVLLFGHHLDITLTTSIIRALQVAERQDLVSPMEVETYTRSTAAIYAFPKANHVRTLLELEQQLRNRRTALDSEINRAILDNRPVDYEILYSVGTPLLFASEVLRTSFELLQGTRLSFLLDELENLTEPHQRYVQQLIRSIRTGTTMIIGSRTYGIRTYETLTDGETNRPGSEFDEIQLDDTIRNQPASVFRNFCVDLATKRFAKVKVTDVDMQRMFEDTNHSDEMFLQDIAKRPHSPALERLLRNLQEAGWSEPTVVREVSKLVNCPDDRLLEKAALLAFYQDMNRGGSPADVALTISHEITAHVAGERARLARLLQHFRRDFLAQLRREYYAREVYGGFDSIVLLADGNPRSFVNIMRAIITWSEIMGDAGKSGTAYSIEAQTRAITDVSDWFYNDSLAIGENATEVRLGIERITELFQKMRFSDKIVESSLCAFLVDENSLSQRTKAAIRTACAWSLLVQRPRRYNRNDSRRLIVFQLNRMLAPKWNLPTGRRGILELSADEVDNVFDNADRTAFDDWMAARLRRMTLNRKAPVGEKAPTAPPRHDRRLF